MQYYRHERSNASLRSVVEVVRFILYEELPKQQSANKGKLKGSVSWTDQFMACKILKYHEHSYSLINILNFGLYA